MSAPSSSNAAMNLWQKFSDMQQAIDAAREERSELERELETCHEKREAIREKKQEDAHTRQTATKHAAAFHQQIAELQTEYSQTVQPAYTAELLQKEKVASQLERWKEYKATAFQTALEESRQFRSNCQRLRLSASMLGLSQASMRAAILAHHVATPTASHDKTVLQDDDWLWKRGGKENSVVEKSNNEERNDPDTWNIPENDDEMNDLFAAYKDKKRAYDAANTELASRKRRKQEMIQDDKGRADKIRLLQKQLDRVVKETKDLSSQIKEYQQLTEESNSMAENYEQREFWAWV